MRDTSAPGAVIVARFGDKNQVKSSDFSARIITSSGK